MDAHTEHCLSPWTPPVKSKLHERLWEPRKAESAMVQHCEGSSQDVVAPQKSSQDMSRSRVKICETQMRDDVMGTGTETHAALSAELLGEKALRRKGHAEYMLQVVNNASRSERGFVRACRPIDLSLLPERKTRERQLVGHVRAAHSLVAYEPTEAVLSQGRSLTR